MDVEGGRCAEEPVVGGRARARTVTIVRLMSLEATGMAYLVMLAL
jgi:hypothetical protein